MLKADNGMQIYSKIINVMQMEGYFICIVILQ